MLLSSLTRQLQRLTERLARPSADLAGLVALTEESSAFQQAVSGDLSTLSTGCAGSAAERAALLW